MEKRWRPCWCCVLLGVLAIVFAWWQVSWGPIALTAVGAAVILRGVINKCCCELLGRKGEGSSCCG